MKRLARATQVKKIECFELVLGTKLDNIDKLESMDLLQKDRIRWDVEGDENFKFFHGIINSKRHTQTIQGILHEGVWISDPSAINMDFINFYKDKFSCHDSSIIFSPIAAAKRLSDSERLFLDLMVSLEEIRSADIMKLDIQNFMVRFFTTGSFPPGTNSSFFTLILKVANPLYIKDFRPISLIGFQYKIVAKILANRLSKVIDWYKKRKKKMLLFKVDFEKAFDSVSWRFLDHVMDNLGFSNTWRRWIKAGLMSLRASILVNGSPTSEFSLKRELRQGDPLSPFLFIIVMEGLHIALRDDDVIILSEWNQSDMENIIRILNVFYLASGLKINISKSNLNGVGVSSDEVIDASRYSVGDGSMKNQNCLIKDRIVEGSWMWDWRRPVNGGRTQADLNNLLAEIGSLIIEVDRDSLVSSFFKDGSYSVSIVRKHIDSCILPSSLPSTMWTIEIVAYVIVPSRFHMLDALAF
ncbi:putative RNA-directed DNA polymerase, eukaryota, reverse transcriptase zinc-binding domain protein [Tanacetum coccineum]